MSTITYMEAPLWDADSCLKIREMALETGTPWAPTVNDGQSKLDIRKTTGFTLPEETIQGPEYRKMMHDLISSCLASNVWNFRLYADNNLTTGVQILRYLPGDFYMKHTDWGSIHGTRKISLTMQLSDPSEYKGGGMVLYDGPDPLKANKTQGTATFFPSWTLHEVKPVMKGERWALVCWFNGPPYC